MLCVALCCSRLLKEMGVSTLERNLLEGLQASQRRLSGKYGGLDLDVQQLSSQALARLAANPPTKVGRVQRATAKWLLRVSRLGIESRSFFAIV